MRIDWEEFKKNTLAKHAEKLLPDPTPEAVEDVERRKRAGKVQAIQRLMGGPSIYDGAIWDELRQTPVLQFLDELDADNCLLLGSVGCGKTMGIIAYTVRLGQPAIFLTAYDLAYLIQQRENDELKRLERVAVLIVDDLGTEPEGFKGKDFLAHFERLFDQRYVKQKRTFMTSNMTVEQIKAQYGERFISRLRQSGRVLDDNSKDMRVRAGERTNENMQTE